MHCQKKKKKKTFLFQFFPGPTMYWLDYYAHTQILIMANMPIFSNIEWSQKLVVFLDNLYDYRHSPNFSSDMVLSHLKYGAVALQCVNLQGKPILAPIKGYLLTPNIAYFFQSDIWHWGQRLVDIQHSDSSTTLNTLFSLHSEKQITVWAYLRDDIKCSQCYFNLNFLWLK